MYAICMKSTSISKYLNSLHHNIEFTIECEENNRLSFLDLQLIVTVTCWT